MRQLMLIVKLEGDSLVAVVALDHQFFEELLGHFSDRMVALLSATSLLKASLLLDST